MVACRESSSSHRVQLPADYSVCSILGVILIANPLRVVLDDHGREPDSDHIPTDLMHKLFGFGIVVPILFLGASESGYLTFAQTPCRVDQI